MELNRVWSDRTVLVTGGAGFIGSNLVRKLLELGSKVRVADNLSRGSLENLEFPDRISFVKLDLTNMDNCMVATKGMDYVFHLAAPVGGIHFIKKYNVENLTPGLLMNTNMLEAARRNDVERYLFASSACIYQERSDSLNEFEEVDAYPANPATTYGWTKLVGEIQCRSYHSDYGIKCCAPRIFNAYGENENLDPRWSHVIPSLIRKALSYPREGFKIFGDGRQERAFLYVRDCVEGLMHCMEKIEDADPINLGSEELTSINDLAEDIVKLSGKNIRLEYDLSGPQGTHRYCASTAKMKQVLRWTPKVVLHNGLARTFEWARERIRVEG
jgi:nucleoside-diphosphate-sugar epimerase